MMALQSTNINFSSPFDRVPLEPCVYRQYILVLGYVYWFECKKTRGYHLLQFEENLVILGFTINSINFSFPFDQVAIGAFSLAFVDSIFWY